MFAYIVEEDHFQTEDTIIKVLTDDTCDLHCETCESLVNAIFIMRDMLLYS